jgi:sarcosine oxidase
MKTPSEPGRVHSPTRVPGTGWSSHDEIGQPASHTASEYVVVGAGLAGAATAWHLAAAGHEVTILERGVPADPNGSSHGSARIFRYAYPDPFYARLVTDARRVWSELEQAHGEQLIRPTGSLDFGAVRKPRALAEVLNDIGVEHELVAKSAAAERWVDITVDYDVLWHPGAGVIDAERSVRAMIDQARSHGARLMTSWDVTSVSARGSGYRLRSSNGSTADARQVVIAAGSWLPSLLGALDVRGDFLSAIPHITVLQEQAYHFPYRDPSAAWPTFIHKSDSIQTYSLPGGRDAGFRGQKLAQYCGGRSISTGAAQDGRVDPANRQRMIEYVEQFLPGLTPEPYAETTCLFTNTPTEDFILDRCDGITVLSPCSGHGAKFAPLIGRLAAEVASASTASVGRAAAPPEFRVPFATVSRRHGRPLAKSR